ncbi:hypothetical protein AB0O00_27090, partial [Kitasatospora sp. NPDC093558]
MPVNPYEPWPTAEHPSSDGPVISAEAEAEPDDEADDEAATAELPVVSDAEPTPAPVFVDASGRRQRRIRRLGLALAVPAGGYLALLTSALLGGPTVNAPFLPLPQPPAPSAPDPAATPSEAPSAGPVAAAAP